MQNFAIFVSITVSAIAIFLMTMYAQNMSYGDFRNTFVNKENIAIVDLVEDKTMQSTETVIIETAKTEPIKSNEVLRNEIQSHWNNKEYALSAKISEQLIQRDATHPYEYSRIIWAYIVKLDMRNKALKMSQKLLEQNPNHAEPYNLTGWSYLSLKDYDKAESYLKKALELSPLSAATYLNFGDLRLEQLQHAKARINYQKAIEIDGSDGAIGAIAKKQLDLLVK